MRANLRYEKNQKREDVKSHHYIRSEEHTSELQSRGLISYAVFCLKKNFFNDTATTEIYTLSLHDALPICGCCGKGSYCRKVGERREQEEETAGCGIWLWGSAETGEWNVEEIGNGPAVVCREICGWRQAYFFVWGFKLLCDKHNCLCYYKNDISENDFCGNESIFIFFLPVYFL